MEWYKGGVVNAISKCRHEKALFIVYISGMITYYHFYVTSTFTCSLLVYTKMNHCR